MSTTSYLVITVLVGLAALGVIAALWLSDQPRAADPSRGGSPMSDVTMDSCVITSYGSPKAVLRIRNSTSSERDYVVSVVFERGGTQVGSGVATVVDLRAGQAAEAEAVGFDAEGGDINCRVSNVRRI